MNPITLNRLARYCALISFLLGTFLLGWYVQSLNSKVEEYGFYYLVVAAVLNILILFVVITVAIRQPKERKRLGKSAGLMLINIPITVLYFWVVMALQDYVRVQIKNTTDSMLTEIQISGCGEASLESVPPKEEKSVWLKLEREGSLECQYRKNGIPAIEPISGYLCPGLPGRFDIVID
ncbi:MAG: hypothetical protein EP332_09595 [Bacteroidetes bacterium]|nr:MAG: hypothetical protein EP332_09595 [Bacteroidota bacterium]